MEFVSRILDGTISYDLKDALRSSVSTGYRVSRDEKIRHLEKVSFLAECTQRQLRAVAALSKVVEMPAGSVLMRAGEPGDEFFVIIDGAAMVEISPRKRRRMGPGEFVGEMSLLDGEPRSATVTAGPGLETLALTRTDFLSLVDSEPSLARALIVALCGRIRALEQVS